MVIRGPLGIIIGLIITLIVVFVIVLPQLNKSNALMDQGMQMQSQAMDQAQQQLDQAQEQMDDAFGEDEADDASGDSASGDSAATAEELAKCVSDAGTDVEALSACQEQFAP